MIKKKTKKKQSTYWGLGKMETFLDIFRCIICNKNHYHLIKISLNLVPEGQIDNIQHWFRKWLGATRQQAIIWTNVGQHPGCHMILLGLNELTWTLLSADSCCEWGFKPQHLRISQIFAYFQSAYKEFGRKLAKSTCLTQVLLAAGCRAMGNFEPCH